jgi:hypothetical protein
MSHPFASSVRRGAIAVALAIAVAGCGSAKVTPIVVYVTASPSPTEEATPTPEPTMAPTPEPTPTDTPTDSAASATPTDTPSATPTDAFTPGPIASPGPASACTGSSDPVHGSEYIAFWEAAVTALPFSVYCGIVPGGWFFNGSVFTQPNGGHLQAKYSYKTTSGPSIVIDEGGDASKFTSVSLGGSLGSASFGGLVGTIYAGSSGGFVLQVAPGTSHAYQAVGTGVTQATFVSVAAKLMQIART